MCQDGANYKQLSQETKTDHRVEYIFIQVVHNEIILILFYSVALLSS